MALDFPGHEDAMRRTLEVAERCDVEIELGRIHLPRFDVPEGRDSFDYLVELCEKGLLRRYGKSTPELEDRLRYELKTIKEMGFTDYFLIVWDFIHFAKTHGVSVGPGRGSSAGSLVAYTLQITDIDPIRYDLMFERFLNPGRKSMPDIDIDFAVEGRERVINYVREKYGNDRVAQIITFSTMAARAAVRDAGRVLEVPYGVVDKNAKLIPEGPGQTLADAGELRKVVSTDPVAKEILELAEPLEGLTRADSIHAAGVVIGAQPLINVVPLQQKGSDQEVVTQFSMKDIEALGLLKMDFLGLRNLDVIDKACELIGGLDISSVPMDDKKTYAMLAKGDAVGVFQFESSGMREALRQVKPTQFEDLIALVALYRPGPMAYIPSYGNRKAGREAITYVDKRLEPILKDTFGICIYQESYMRIARELAGFSITEADDLRKAIGKKIRALMESLKDRFFEGAAEQNVTPQAAKQLWEDVEKAADYSFPKAHAACYALIAYQTAWLRQNHPCEYMAALISSVMSTKDRVPFYVNACAELGIDVLPPDVNESMTDFAVVDGKIRFGLNAVKGVGEGACRSVIAAREADGPFESIWDFAERVDPSVSNKRVLEALVKCGAVPGSRKGNLEVLEQAVAWGQKQQADRLAGQGSIFDLAGAGGGATVEEKAKHHPATPTEEYEKNELLRLEKEVLGLYVSEHPLSGIREQLRRKSDATIGELDRRRDGEVVTVGGIVAGLRHMTTKRGDAMVFLRLEDVTGGVETVVFNSTYDKARELCVADRILIVKGRIDRKEGETKLVALEIAAFEAVPEMREVRLKIDATKARAGTIRELAQLIRDFPGESPVYADLITSHGKKVYAFGPQFKVKPAPDFYAEVKMILGESAVA
jgi:DNA polymerase-3 subunit alpha